MKARCPFQIQSELCTNTIVVYLYKQHQLFVSWRQFSQTTAGRLCLIIWCCWKLTAVWLFQSTVNSSTAPFVWCNSSFISSNPCTNPCLTPKNKNMQELHFSAHKCKQISKMSVFQKTTQKTLHTPTSLGQVKVSFLQDCTCYVLLSFLCLWCWVWTSEQDYGLVCCYCSRSKWMWTLRKSFYILFLWEHSWLKVENKVHMVSRNILCFLFGSLLIQIGIKELCSWLKVNKSLAGFKDE